MNLKEAFENASKSMDITNPNQRDVICIDNTDHTWCGNDHASQFLSVGKTYHVEHIEVHSWHTQVTLKEFPDQWFNSIAFAEKEMDE